MDQLITLVTNLLNLTKVAAVTFPGLLLAAALAIMFWPPAPIDLIPIVHLLSEAPTNLRRELPKENPAIGHIAAVCDITLLPVTRSSVFTAVEDVAYGASYGAPDSAKLFAKIDPPRPASTSFEVNYQYLLDAEQIRLAECTAAETAMKDVEKNEQAIRDRERDLETLQLYTKLVGLRLADPGRLRPRLAFDAFIGLQTTQVIGFILFSIVLGVVVVPIRDTLVSFFAERLFGRF